MTKLSTLVGTFEIANEKLKNEQYIFFQLNDTHAFANLSDYYYKDIFGARAVGFKARFIQGQLLVTKLADDQFKDGEDLQIGDIITEIAGSSVSSLSDSLGPYVAASNESARKRDLPRWMLRTRDSLLLVKVRRDDREFQVHVPTRKIETIRDVEEEPKQAIRKLRDGIVVVDIGAFRDSDTQRLKDSLQNQKGLILDYRNYPSASVHEELSGMIFPSQQEFVLFSTSHGMRPGQFKYRPSYKVGTKNPTAFKGKIVMLVDETTQSASEFQVMAFRTISGSQVIGSQTAGADGNISWLQLPLGYSTAFSGLGVYYPDKSETQGVGIIPDKIVLPTIHGIRQHQDEILQSAIDTILN